MDLKYSAFLAAMKDLHCKRDSHVENDQSSIRNLLDTFDNRYKVFGEDASNRSHLLPNFYDRMLLRLRTKCRE